MSSSQTRKRSQRLGSHSESISEVAKRQVHQVGTIAQDGLSSGTWVYPILGVFYLTSHPSLIKPLLPTLFKGLLISAATVIALFTFTYLPQVAVLAVVSGPLAFILAIPLVLSESYVVLTFLTKGMLMGQVGVDLFDAVLLQKGHQTLVENGRQVNSKGGTAKQLGGLVMKPLAKFNLDNIVRYLLTLPLNFIPVVGTAFFLGYNGYKSGPGYHSRYFQLKGYDKDQRQAFIKKRRGAYFTFGTMSMVLNLVPVVSILMTFTTVTGAALWAADLENKVKPNPQQQLKDGRAKIPDEVEVSIPKPGSNSEVKKEL